jgi:hypothetical protein
VFSRLPSAMSTKLGAALRNAMSVGCAQNKHASVTRRSTHSTHH